MRLGGWEHEGTPERFAAYCRRVMGELGSLIPWVCTINEANIAALTRRMIEDRMSAAGAGQAPVGVGGGLSSWREAGAAALRTTPEKLNVFLLTFTGTALEIVKRSHVRAREVIREVSPSSRVGITLALQDYQALPGGEEAAADRWAESFEDFLPAVEGDDFLGVQNYSRVLLGPDGVVVPDGAELTQMGYEFYPQALENVLRRAAVAGLPMVVTENGVASTDDTRRAEFVRLALEGVQRAVDDGVDVRGYLYWSALDNYEWMLGYGPRFGIVAVDRETQERTVKDSARYLGAVARRNALT